VMAKASHISFRKFATYYFVSSHGAKLQAYT
jgi:hypothetical protein